MTGNCALVRTASVEIVDAGESFWVRVPELCAVLDKQGFRWRKRWSPRVVGLTSAGVLWYHALPKETPGSAKAGPARLSAMTKSNLKHNSVQLSEVTTLEELDDCTLQITPAAGQKSWVLRTNDIKIHMKWCQAIRDCIALHRWQARTQIGVRLGKGGQSVVRRLDDSQDKSQRLAVKIIDIATKSQMEREAIATEITVMREISMTVSHENLVKIHRVYEVDQMLYVVMELGAGGDLYRQLLRRGRFSERDAARTIKQLMLALQALHAKKILHLDIKLENILLSSADDADARIMLADFGLAQFMSSKQTQTQATMSGTVGYIAPEIVTSHSYSPAADVFSAGVVLFILLVGYPPFCGDSKIEILLKISRGDVRFHANDWDSVSPAAMELVAKMLAARVQDRITVDEVLAHPWIAVAAE